MSVSVVGSTSYSGPFETIEVNREKPLELDTAIGRVLLSVRIKNWKQGEPEPYFEHGSRTGERFSLQATIQFSRDVKGDELLFGNDFDNPIRDILPYGFSVAYKSFTTFIDPAVQGDLYADKPYVYGPAVASINFIVQQKSLDWEYPVQDPTSDERRKTYGSDPELRKEVIYKKGEVWAFEFATPYLDMSEKLSINLPGGINFDVGHYAKQSSLRYVLKNNDELVFAVVISLPENSPVP